jgi:hypothetical protein
MREIIIPFNATVKATDGIPHRVRVIGHERADGIWEGVIEFVRDGSRLITGIETTQTNADALEYWATGLQPVYFEAALRRARRPGTRRSLAHQPERRA